MGITLLSNNLEDRFLGNASMGSYTYTAYASDSSGADFSTVYNSSVHTYVAILTVDEEIGNPQASDFTSKWFYINPVSVITDIENAITSIEADITSIEGDITSIEEDITSIEEDITSIEEDITSIEEDITSLISSVGDNTSDISSLSSSKADTDAGNIAPETYAANWWELANYWNNSVQTIEVRTTNQTILNTTSIVKINTNWGSGVDIDINLPDATLSQNKGKTIYFVIEAQSTPGGEAITVKDGLVSLFSRILYNGWFENISVRSNGTNWYVVSSNVQGTTEYPGVWEKATPSEVTSGTSDKVITADNITSLIATEGRAGIQRNATSEEAIAMSSSSLNITPSTLGTVLNNVKCATININDWNMDTTDTKIIDIQPLGLVPGTNYILFSATIIYGDNGYYSRLEEVTSSGTLEGGVRFIETETAYIYRTSGGIYDDSNYSAPTVLRGVLYIWYI